MKFLNEDHVTHDITVDHFDEVVANITNNSNLGFSNKMFPTEGKVRNKAFQYR